jgi:Suppressor of fused protein (SUFU)
MRDRRSGSAFSRFKDKARSLVERQKRPAASARSLFVITDHIEKYFGANFFVLHEKQSHLVHIDVYVVSPSVERPYHTLLTSGMSDRTMRLPRGVEAPALAEVCLCLPHKWPINRTDMEWATPDFFWPMKVLKEVARYPHLHETWLSRGDTIGNIEHPEPLDPGGRFVGLVLLNPLTFPVGAERVAAEDGREIRYLAIIPLLKPELALQLEHGSDALEDRLMAAEITELLNPHRESVIPC